ncbi:MAG: hypothetical protein LUF00_12660, partial [Lachnospiraceae bacterium]|nr:hypothetical protein [Lachnospiraceae bacterium]
CCAVVNFSHMGKYSFNSMALHLLWEVSYHTLWHMSITVFDICHKWMYDVSRLKQKGGIIMSEECGGSQGH